MKVYSADRYRVPPLPLVWVLHSPAALVGYVDVNCAGYCRKVMIKAVERHKLITALTKPNGGYLIFFIYFIYFIYLFFFFFQRTLDGLKYGAMV